MNTKKIAITTLVLAILVSITIFGVKAVNAEDNSTYPPLIQKLIDRFNLNGDEVKQVFDEHRQERHQQMKVRFEERLDQAVSEGKITQEQKEAFLAKKDEFMANCNGDKKQHQEEMRTWTEENGIDLELFRAFGNRGRKFFK
ncbi:hypothetical protein KKE45_03650 [Patescibacteria group bacterium]|nr:hypothetical protein [Patescibacteria group bacterium]